MALSSQEAGLLTGIRVLEAASMIMVPSVGAVLADYGAEVIKLQPIEGDLNRRGHQIPGMPVHDYEYCFLPDNRGKRSLAIDLKAPEARAVLRRLVEGADVFLTNHRPRSLESLGLGLERAAGDQSAPGVRARHRFRRRRRGDRQAGLRLGVLLVALGHGGEPVSTGRLAGIARLRHRRSSRRHGAPVRSAARPVCSRAKRPRHAGFLLAARERCVVEFGHDPGQAARGAVPGSSAREDARSFTSVYYRAADRRVFKMVVVDTRRDWPKICRAIGRPDLADDPRYATLEARLEPGRMGELVRLCDRIFAGQPMQHWQRALEQADVAYSVVANFDDVIADRQMSANGVFVEIDDPVLGRVRTVDTPLKIEGQPKVTRAPAPRLGEHTRAILAEIGLDAQEIDALAQRRVVADHVPPSAPIPGPQ